jgi:hypothetical protein
MISSSGEPPVCQTSSRVEAGQGWLTDSTGGLGVIVEGAGGVARTRGVALMMLNMQSTNGKAAIEFLNHDVECIESSADDCDQIRLNIVLYSYEVLAPLPNDLPIPLIGCEPL